VQDIGTIGVPMRRDTEDWALEVQETYSACLDLCRSRRDSTHDVPALTRAETECAVSDKRHFSSEIVLRKRGRMCKMGKLAV